MTYIISYSVHIIGSILFFLLIPFPYLIKGSLNDRAQFKLVLTIYKRITWLAHIAIITGLISGLLLQAQWLSAWFILVIFIWMAIGAFLGMTAKMIRVILEKDADRIETNDEIAKLKRFSILLMITIVLMFVTKFMNFL